MGFPRASFLRLSEKSLKLEKMERYAGPPRRVVHVSRWRWYTLSLRADVPQPQGSVASLDVSVLQDRVLDPILGIKDVRTDKRIDFVGGVRGSEELKRLVDEGKAAVAFSLFPTTMEDLLVFPTRVKLCRPSPRGLNQN